MDSASQQRLPAHLSVFPHSTLDHDPHGGNSVFRTASSLTAYRPFPYKYLDPRQMPDRHAHWQAGSSLCISWLRQPCVWTALSEGEKVYQMPLSELSGRFLNNLPSIYHRHVPMQKSCPPHYLPTMPVACRPKFPLEHVALQKVRHKIAITVLVVLCIHPCTSFRAILRLLTLILRSSGAVVTVLLR